MYLVRTFDSTLVQKFAECVALLKVTRVKLCIAWSLGTDLAARGGYFERQVEDLDSR